MRSLEVTVLLATIAGIAFLCFADILVLFKPTRWAGVILQDRFINVKHNWDTYPVRSFVEFGCFMGVIYGSYAIYHDLIVAVQVGTLSGMLVTLGGEQVRSCARALPLNGKDATSISLSDLLCFQSNWLSYYLLSSRRSSEERGGKHTDSPTPSNGLARACGSCGV